MAEESPAKKRAQTSIKFTDEERAEMRERSRELKAGASEADGESAVLAKIAAMPAPDRVMAERLHAIIKASAPALSPRTYYRMPAYAKDSQIVCFLQSAQKFKTRYTTLGFSDKAKPLGRVCFYGTRDIAPRSGDSPSGRTTWCSGRSLIAADAYAAREVPDRLVVDVRKFFRRQR
jgi:hypothetical protein